MKNLVINGRVFTIKSIGRIVLEADKKDRADLIEFADATDNLQITICASDSAITLSLLNSDDDVVYVNVLVK